MSSKDKEQYEFLEDTNYEGKNKAYLDVDRMINEGMSGGSVHMRAESANIEEATDLTEETPPSSMQG
ncbi:hypothetical protein [Falsibacillus pallidus]|uniref:Uncharacterized protein n=1 Tax=Falsibacillus pallidus TaxID=493781 RepID=A0A370GZ14_9BACI|nr:hypothetical protein [Falsibacillus pallidus]RDI47894.1 hypothetical protein DFR59_101559 [Falsibacillus pallidus]